MDDPYNNRKNKPYKEMAEVCEDLADAADGLAIVAWGFAILTVVLLGISTYIHFFS